MLHSPTTGAATPVWTSLGRGAGLRESAELSQAVERAAVEQLRAVDGSVLVLQALHGLSDGEAVAALRFDLRWKAAWLAVTDTGFDPSTLTYWRRRLAASSRPNRIFESPR